MADTPVLPRSAGTVLLLTAAVFLIIGIQAIAYIITIIVISLILAMIVYPATKALRSRGLPEIAAVAVVAVIACLAVLLICYRATRSCSRDCAMLSSSFGISLPQHAFLATEVCEACGTTWRTPGV